MVTVGLLIRLKAKPGQESEVEKFLESAGPIVDQEPATTAWFGIRLGPSEYGIFNAFPDEAGRQAHMTGHGAEALFARAGELFAQPPAVEPVDILTAKLPG
jgi:quinol monooxygenase YgiN